MSLVINYPVSAAGVLVLVTLGAYVGGNLRRNLFCPEYRSDDIDPGSYCYWSLANALLVPCVVALLVAGLGLVVRAVSVTLAFARLLLTFMERAVRSLVKGYPWCCLLSAVVLFGPWDWRLGWVITGFLARCISLLCATLFSAVKLAPVYFAHLVLCAWSRIQLETAVCERVRAKAIDPHVAFGLIWLPFFAGGTGRRWLGYIWRTTNSDTRQVFSSPLHAHDVPTPIDYARLRAQLMEQATAIATRRCHRISEAMMQQLGGWSVAHSWTVNFELSRLEREHPARKGLEQWKQEKERQAVVWNSIRARPKARQVIPGAYDTSTPRPDPLETQQDRNTNAGDLSGRGVVNDLISMVLRPALILPSFVRFPSWLSLPSCGGRAAPGSEPVLASTIDQSAPRAPVASSSPQSPQRSQPRRRTRFGASSSRNATIGHSPTSLTAPRLQSTSKAVFFTKSATRTPITDVPLRAATRSSSFHPNSSSGSSGECAVFGVTVRIHKDFKWPMLETSTLAKAGISNTTPSTNDEPLEACSQEPDQDMTTACGSSYGMPNAVGPDCALQRRKTHAEPTTAPRSEVRAPRPLYDSTGFLQLNHPVHPCNFLVARPTPNELMEVKTDFASASSAAHVPVSAIIPPFSRMVIEDDVDVEMALDAVDTPDITMGTPELEDTDMFDLPTPPSPMLIELPGVPEVSMESPALQCLPDTTMEPGVGSTTEACEATVSAYVQPGAWEGFMVWHKELARGTAVPAFSVPPIPQEWSRPTRALDSDFGSTRQEAGCAWNEAYPELQSYANVWVPEFGPDVDSSIRLVEHTSWSGAAVEPPTMAAEDYGRQASIDGFTPSFTDIYVPACQVIEPTNDAPSSEWTYAISEPASYGIVQHVEYAHQDRVDVAELAQAFESMCAPGLETSTSQAAVEYPIATAESAAHEWTEIIEHAASGEYECQDQSTVVALAQAFASMSVPDAESIAVSETIEATSEDLCRPETEPVPVPASHVEPENVGHVAMDDLVNSLKCMRTSGVDYTQSQVSEAMRVAVITEVSGSSGPDFVGLEADEDESDGEDEDELAEVERQLEAELDAETEDEEAEANPGEGLGIEDPDAAAEAFLAGMQAQGLLGPVVPESFSRG